MNFFRLILTTAVIVGAVVTITGSSGCKDQQPLTLQGKLDAYCMKRGKELLDGAENLKRVEAFYSSVANTCVQIEVDDADKDWRYDLVDVSDGLYRNPQHFKAESTLHVYHEDRYGFASTEGFWEAADSSKDKQLIDQIAVKISCDKHDGTCKENDASVLAGIVSPDSEDYQVTRWDVNGIIADDSDTGRCAIGHRLSMDFVTNSVTVTDYPTGKDAPVDCKAFQTTNAYALHGGEFGTMNQRGMFTCDKDGVSSVIVAKVQAVNGNVADRPYSDFMDDGEGGQPATTKTPAHPFSKDDCERAMDKKLSELRQ